MKNITFKKNSITDYWSYSIGKFQGITILGNLNHKTVNSCNTVLAKHN